MSVSPSVRIEKIVTDTPGNIFVCNSPSGPTKVISKSGVEYAPGLNKTNSTI